ncbi:MAG: hypothetical protein Fur0046_20060 [Cyanobacteria bacterium J069]
MTLTTGIVKQALAIGDLLLRQRDRVSCRIERHRARRSVEFSGDRSPTDNLEDKKSYPHN